MKRLIFRADRLFIKICGVCSTDDAETCLAAGADAIGMLLGKRGAVIDPQSDQLTLEEAAALSRTISERLPSVILIHSTNIDTVSDIYEAIRPSALQLQSDFSNDELRALKARLPDVQLIKTLYVTPGKDAPAVIADVSKYLQSEMLDAINLDSARGGSGEAHDWNVSKAVVASAPPIPILLAGGLNPANVAAAILTVKPDGVDAMSALNTAIRRKKDPQKIADFIHAARNASTEPDDVRNSDRI